jgi:parallel beta-helix repeat protein
MGIYTDDGVLISGNQVSDNRAVGIYIDTDATKGHFVGNTTNRDGYYGIAIGRSPSARAAPAWRTRAGTSSVRTARLETPSSTCTSRRTRRSRMSTVTTVAGLPSRAGPTGTGVTTTTVAGATEDPV